MPRLSVAVGGEHHRLEFAPGASLREILDATRYRVRSACLGLGACGLCRVRLRAGDGGAPTDAERAQLTAAELAAGLRLACQCRPVDDIDIEIASPAAASEWRTPAAGLLPAAALSRRPDRPPPPGTHHPLGAAVDLGTSHVTVAVFDLLSGHLLAARWGRNPQGRFGADVVTRLVAAEDAATAATLAELARDAIGAALADIAAREGLDPARICRLVVVGNTAMTALLSGRNHGLLLQPAYWTAPVDCVPARIDWAPVLGVAPRAEVELAPPLGGFVGSDLVAGLIAGDFMAGPEPALFIDFGTNSEIVLRVGDRLWATAAAGGPAFELGSGRCGMPAEAGAIHRVSFGDDGRPICAVLGDDRALGLCGSGLVDLVAGLRRRGTITATGKFADGGTAYDVAAGDTPLQLTLNDIDVLQRAKAAIGAGIEVLCGEAGVRPAALRRVVAAGLFGRYLDIANAQSIGLLPAVAAGCVELAGNTALAGAAALLLSRAAGADMARCHAACRLINLAKTPAFDDAFLEHLYLRPGASAP